MEKKLQNYIDELHQKAFTVDAHFDLTYDLQNRRERGERLVVKNEYLPSFKKGGFDLVVSAIFIHDMFLPEMGLRRALDQIIELHEEVEETPGLFRICKNMKEAQLAKEAGELALFLSLEGLDPIGNDLKLLKVFYEMGVRGLGLVWSRRNYVGDGAFFKPKHEGKKGGLTHFGIQVVKKAEELGMFLDLSHLNDEGFWDVMDIATKPVIASHSNCRVLADTMRNLTDEQIKAVAQLDGVIGMNSVSQFVNLEKQSVTIADLVDHVDHIVKLVGVEHVGIGFDICSSFHNFLSMQDSIVTQDLIENHSKLDLFTAELVKRKYSEKDILAILGGNLARVYTVTLE